MNDALRVKERLNIVDVVGEYVRLTKAGANYKARCPFHEEKSPSFVVTEDRGSYHCFGCGVGGDMISFVMEIESMEFRDALKLLADRAGIELTKYTPEQKAAQEKVTRLYELMTMSVKFYQKQLWEGGSSKTMMKYLHDRGISDDMITRFRIGFAPDGWDHIHKFLTSKNYTAQEMTSTGMLIAKDTGGHYDRFRARIMFPISDPLGRTIGYSARALPGDDDQAKYINTPESPLYHKSDVLYGIDLAKQAIKKADRVIIVEGNMDVIAAHQADTENTVAISGTSLTAQHIAILKRYTTNFTLFFDADHAGQKAAAKSALTCFENDINLSLVSLHEGKDASDLVQEDPEALRRVVAEAKNAFTYFMDAATEKYDLDDPRDKRHAVEEILTFAAAMPHAIERSAWVKKCAQAFMIKEDDANDIVEGIIKDRAGPRAPVKKEPVQEETVESDGDTFEDTSPSIKNLIFSLLAFPDIWEAMFQKKDTYDFWTKNIQLQSLMREGPGVEYSSEAFLEKVGRINLYQQVQKVRDGLLDTHPDTESRIRYLEENLERAQKEYDRKKLIFYMQKKGHAEKVKDQEAIEHYTKEIEKLGILHTQQ